MASTIFSGRYKLGFNLTFRWSFGAQASENVKRRGIDRAQRLPTDIVVFHSDCLFLNPKSLLKAAVNS